MGKSLFQLALLFSFLGLFFYKEKAAGIKKHFSLFLLGLVLLGFAAQCNFLSFHGGITHVHNLEMYHYYMGSKYFPETGYTKLYEASVIADSEDDPYFKPELPVRSLETYALVTRESILKRKAEILSSFTPDRWREFKKDLSVFRKTAPTNWGKQFGYRDHGYNGTPLVTAVLSWISSQPWQDTAAFIKIAACFDAAAILLTAGLLAWLLNRDAALLFLFFLALNPFNDFSMIGGAYLRYDYFLALALAAACFRRGFLAAGGIFTALSGLFRVFPFFCAGSLFLSQCLHKDRRILLRKTAPFYSSCLIAGIVLFFLTSPIKGPDHQNPWVSFGKQIKLHGSQLNVNKMGFKYLFYFADRHNIRKVLATWPAGARLNWVEESQKTFESQKTGYWVTMAIFLGAFLFFLTKASGVETFFGGIALAYCLLMLSNYYYCVLSLIPLFFSENRKVTFLTASAFAVMIFLTMLPGVSSVPDRRFFILCGFLFIFFAVLLDLKRPLLKTA